MIFRGVQSTLRVMAKVPCLFSEAFLTVPVPLILCLIRTIWVLLLILADSLADKLHAVFVCNVYSCFQEKLLPVNFIIKLK